MSSADDGNWDWLEDPKGADGLKWGKQETERTQQYLDSLPQAQELQAKLQGLLESNAPPPRFVLGERLFRLRRDVVHKQGILETAKFESPDDWKTVIDIDELGKREEKAWELSPWTLLSISSSFISQDSSRLLLLLSEGGSDEVWLREFDVDQGVSVPNGFQAGPGRFTAAWLDFDHILISHALDGGPKCPTGWPTNTYLWTRGTDLHEAKLVHSGATSDALVISSAVGDGETRRGLIMRAITYAKMRYYTVALDGTVEEVALPEALGLNSSPAATSRHLTAYTTEPALVDGVEVPRGTLLAWDYVGSEKRSTAVYVPESGETILGIVAGAVKASRSKIYFTILKRTKESRLVMEYVDDEWKVVQRTDTPPGTSAKVIAADFQSENIIVESSGLLSPTSLWLKYSNGKEPKDLYHQAAAFDHDKYEIKTQVARSKDGTEIDYFVLAPKQPKPNLPILMTGYGAFGLCFDLAYLNPALGGLTLVPWLESGGALVVPWIRGGGERGEDWHQVALRENRQLSYDDFAAVTEKLITDGLTTPQHIGVFGLSNGGLLAAVMGTQRPELYGAVVSDVPMIDMLRYPSMGMGSAWIYEYGDPKVPEQAKALRSYSPFHNIKTGVKYPAFLTTCSTLDDRVGVGHARKLVAKLKEVDSLTALLYEVGEGGHTVSDPFKDPALMARRIAFFINRLQ